MPRPQAALAAPAAGAPGRRRNGPTGSQILGGGNGRDKKTPLGASHNADASSGSTLIVERPIDNPAVGLCDLRLIART